MVNHESMCRTRVRQTERTQQHQLPAAVERGVGGDCGWRVSCVVNCATVEALGGGGGWRTQTGGRGRSSSILFASLYAVFASRAGETCIYLCHICVADA